MMLFKERSKNLREKAIEYIKNKIDENDSFGFQFEDIYEYLDCQGEVQNCEIVYIGKKYGVDIVGQLSEVEDNVTLEDLSTDSLCEIADKIHLEPLNYIKK